MERIWDLLAEYGPPIVGVVLFLLVGYIVSGWLGRLVRKALVRAKVEQTLAKFLGSVARWGLMVMALIACLGVFSVETTSFAAVIGWSDVFSIAMVSLILSGTVMSGVSEVIVIRHPFANALARGTSR